MSELGEYMTQSNEPTIEEMNEVIGIFMGYKMYSSRYPRNHGIGAPEMEPEKCMIIQKAKYHTSWDWLMLVVEKIRKLGYHIEITISVDCSVEIIKLRGDPIKDVLHIISYSNPINAVYTAVYQFITWYNQQTK